MEICKDQTMINESHLNYLDKIIDDINLNNINGSIVECGVWKGGCCMWMMLCQKKYNMYREFYLYDTFDGMTFPASNKDHPYAKELYNKIQSGEYKRDYDNWHGEKKWAYAPIDLVKNNINKINYDTSKIKYVIGDINCTLDNIYPSSISILRLDTDWYDSTKKELDVLFPLVSKNGYIIVDDYNAWKGARDATDEFLINNKDKVTIIDSKYTGDIFVMKKN